MSYLGQTVFACLAKTTVNYTEEWQDTHTDQSWKPKSLDALLSKSDNKGAVVHPNRCWLTTCIVPLVITFFIVFVFWVVPVCVCQVETVKLE